MAPLPKPQSKIPDLIFAAYESDANDWDGLGFSASDLGTECDRSLWLGLRWAAPKEKMPGRVLRLLDTGDREEERVVADLRRIGMEVDEVDSGTGKQFMARALAGHIRGKLDGVIHSGIPEAPTKPHVLEIKTFGLKGFGYLQAQGVAKAKPEHHQQMQVYMGVTGIDRALYAAVSKNDDALYFERVRFDHEGYVRLLARLERIARSDSMPAPISEKRNAPDCRFCRRKAVCLGESFPRIHCRTCLHSTAEMHGDAAWSCARFAKPLLAEEQRRGCANHLLIPDLVPGTQIDVNEQAETVTYRLRDNSTWIDGEQPSPAPIKPEEEPA